MSTDTTTAAAVADPLRRLSEEDVPVRLADPAVRGVTVDEAVRMMTTADVRAAADVQRPGPAGRGGEVSEQQRS